MVERHNVTADSRNLPEVLRGHGLGRLVGEVPCVVGAPPVNAGHQYPNGYSDNLPWPVYYAYARQWAASIAETLCEGGRAWIAVDSAVPETIGGKDGRRVNLLRLWSDALEGAGLDYRDTITWSWGDYRSGQITFGPFQFPTAPNMMRHGSLITVWYKGTWRRYPPPTIAREKQPREDLGGDWADMCRSVWNVHPFPGRGAKWPEDIPARCIRLSTYPGEWVIDPWGGTGKTGTAAERLGRHSICIEKHPPS